MTINLNDYIDRLPMAFRTREEEKVIIYFKCNSKGDPFIGKDSTGELKSWFEKGNYESFPHDLDIISEWQDEGADHLVQTNDMVLTPELLEDIKAGKKAMKILKYLSAGYYETNITTSIVEKAIQQINSEGV